MGEVDAALLAAMRELWAAAPEAFDVLMVVAKLLRAQRVATISTKVVDDPGSLRLYQGHEDELTGGGD
jgi:hypothetical protein